MIVINDDRVNVIYTRTNRRVKWQYAEYCGRYASIDEAIERAKEYYGDQGFEYRIENRETDEVTTGFVNWR
jgi:hypothetical protein